jgi:MFS family permease
MSDIDPARADLDVGGEGWSDVGEGGTRTAALASLRVPNFRRYFVGQTLSTVGTWFHTLALALVIVELTGSGAALGLVVALQFLPLLFLAGYAGILLDRRDPRLVLLVTNGLNAGVAFGLVAVSISGHLSTWWLGAVSLAFGLLLPFERTAMQIIPVELVEPPLVSNALGLSSLINSLARFVGPALAGLVFTLAGATWCFTVNAVSFLVAGAFLLAIDRDRLFPRPRSRPAPRQIRDGLAYLVRHRRLRSVLGVNALIGLLAINFLVVITAMVQLQFGGDGFEVGLAHAANALGALAGGLLAGATLARMSRRLDLVCLGLGLSLVLLAFAPTLVTFVALGPLLGLTFVAYQSSVLDACRRLARPDMLGRMVSLVTLGAFGTTPIGSLLMGFVIDAWSPRVALGIGAASCVAGAAILGWVRTVDRSTVARPC